MGINVTMLKGICFLTMGAIALDALAGTSEQNYLCKTQETLLFGCDSGPKMISVCASRDFSATTGYVQYRFGTPGKIELSYPEKPSPPKGHFWLSSTAYSGGGVAHLRFTNHGVTYAVFDRMVRTNFTPGEPNDPEMSEGVVVRPQGKKATRRLCTYSEGGIREQAYTTIEREDFDDSLIP
ncbi:hypothetical protein [Pseudomonas azotoformans]|jgi:hypothetical protein